MTVGMAVLALQCLGPYLRRAEVGATQLLESGIS